MPHPCFSSAELIGNRVYECFDPQAFVLHQANWVLVFLLRDFSRKKLVFNNLLLLVS